MLPILFADDLPVAPVVGGTVGAAFIAVVVLGCWAIKYIVDSGVLKLLSGFTAIGHELGARHAQVETALATVDTSQQHQLDSQTGRVESLEKRVADLENALASFLHPVPSVSSVHPRSSS